MDPTGMFDGEEIIGILHDGPAVGAGQFQNQLEQVGQQGCQIHMVTDGPHGADHGLGIHRVKDAVFLARERIHAQREQPKSDSVLKRIGLCQGIPVMRVEERLHVLRDGRLLLFQPVGQTFVEIRFLDEKPAASRRGHRLAIGLGGGVSLSVYTRRFAAQKARVVRDVLLGRR